MVFHHMATHHQANMIDANALLSSAEAGHDGWRSLAAGDRWWCQQAIACTTRLSLLVATLVAIAGSLGRGDAIARYDSGRRRTFLKS